MSDKKLPWNNILNEQNPLRISILGGKETGKSSFIEKLQTGIFQQTYYPTTEFTSILMRFKPQECRSRILLDELGNADLLGQATDHTNIQVSLRIRNRYLDNAFDAAYAQAKISELNYNNDKLKRLVNRTGTRKIHIQLDYYNYYYSSHDSDELVYSKESLNLQQVPSNNSLTHFHTAQLDLSHESGGATYESLVPKVTPILVELVDSPAFNPDLVVPFLELSLKAKIGDEYLHGLVNEPRLPTLTKSLLVGSGASDLNGSIDGYVLMYSAIPSWNPPEYQDTASAPVQSHTSLDLLDKIRSTLHESWQSYKLYMLQTESRKEADMFSISSSLKNLWKTSKQKQKFSETVPGSAKNPELEIALSDDEFPSMIIVCTHFNDYRASPLLVKKGKALASEWNVGFATIDSQTGYNVEESVALIVRDIIEKKKAKGSK